VPEAGCTLGRPGFAFDRDEIDLDQFRIVEPHSRLIATACFTCFIRLRSGIANSHQNKTSPTATADTTQLPCNYGNHMVDRLSPGDGKSGAPAAVPPCSQEPEG
jgi:hypothetical protein